MAGDYELLLQSPAGVPLGALSKVARCTYARGENVGGEMTLLVPPDVYNPSLFQSYGRVLVQRQIGGTQPYVDLNTPWFIVGGPYNALDSSGLATVRFECVDALGLILSSRNIAYNDYTDYTQKLAPADNMMKALLRENAGTLATDTARSLATYLSIQPDATTSAAPTIRMEGMSRRQLLDVLQDIANASANDDTPVWLGFDIVLSDQVTGLLEFQTYIGQRGVDHRQTVGNPPLLLSPELGNLANVEVSTQYKDSASYIYAGGAGVGTIRAVATAQNTALIALSPFGRREKFVDGSQVMSADGLQALAYSELRNSRPRQFMQANLVETNTTIRGIQWDFGDYCTATYQGQTFDVRVDKLAVTLEPAQGGGLVDRSEVYLRGEQAVLLT